MARTRAPPFDVGRIPPVRRSAPDFVVSSISFPISAICALFMGPACFALGVYTDTNFMVLLSAFYLYVERGIDRSTKSAMFFYLRGVKAKVESICWKVGYAPVSRVIRTAKLFAPCTT